MTKHNALPLMLGIRYNISQVLAIIKRLILGKCVLQVTGCTVAAALL